MFKLITLFLLIAYVSFSTAQVSTAVQQCSPGGNCINGNCVQTDACACASGSEGDNCEEGDTEGCKWGELENMATSHIPEFLPEKSGFSAGTLKLAIASPLVKDRLHTMVRIGDGDDEGCIYPYPGNKFWSRSVEGCQDMFVADIPWTQALKCGWEKDDKSDAEWTSYVSHLTVMHYDKIDEFRGQEITRDTEHIIPIRVRFQTVVTVSTEITIYSPVNLLSAITQQTYDPEISEGIIEVTTSLQNPFILTKPVLSGAPDVIIPVLTLEAESCPDDGESPCDQVWRITIDPDSACTLTGDYVLDFELACVDKNDCPVDPNDNKVQLVAEINSEDFCTEIVIDIGLTGTMAVYRDEAHQFEKDDFLYEQVAHFKVQLESEAVIIANRLLEVWIEYDGTKTVFFDGGETQDGIVATYVPYRGGSDWAAFSFVPNEITTPVPEDASGVFDVFAKVEVTYQEEEFEVLDGLDGVQKRRNILQNDEGTQTSTTSAHFALPPQVLNANEDQQQNQEQNPNDGEDPNGEESSTPIIIPVAAVSGGVLCVGMIAIIAIRKRSSDSNEETLP